MRALDLVEFTAPSGWDMHLLQSWCWLLVKTVIGELYVLLSRIHEVNAH